MRSPVQPCVGIGLRRTRAVPTLLTTEGAAVAGRRPVLRLKPVLADPRLDQRTVHDEVLVRQEPVRPLDHPSEEAPGDLLAEQAAPILGEHRRRPDRLVHFESNDQRNSKL
jgi:hypothetical protein